MTVRELLSPWYGKLFAVIFTFGVAWGGVAAAVQGKAEKSDVSALAWRTEQLERQAAQDRDELRRGQLQLEQRLRDFVCWQNPNPACR